MRLARLDKAGNPTTDQLTLHQIGTDGGLLDVPAPLAKLRMAPGERADVLIDFSALPTGSRWRLVNDAQAPYPEGGDGDIAQIMQFTVGKAEGPELRVPYALRGGHGQPARLPQVLEPSAPVRPGALQATTTRTVFLNEIVNDATVPGIEGEPVHVMMGNQFYADEVTMAPRSEQVEAPAVNSVEEWIIVNTTGDAHPIHLHLTQFRLVNRQMLAIDPDSGETTYLIDRLRCGGVDADPANCAQDLPVPAAAGQGPWPAPSVEPYLKGAPIAPIASELGWKDTIIAMPGSVTRIIVPFGGTAAGIPAPFVGDAKNAPIQRFTGNYVFHCHILEHEDNDMMSPLVVR
jgi:FtsP/CotA-like multicopper oxidase with cupredoxin domain